MFHNVLFIVLLLSSIYLLVLAASPRKKKIKIGKIIDDERTEDVINQFEGGVSLPEKMEIEVAQSTEEAIVEDRRKTIFTLNYQKYLGWH